VGALRERLARAAHDARAPILVVQAQNDYDLGPSQALAEPLRLRGDGSATRVYPAFGQSTQEGHGAFSSTTAGIAVWGGDVMTFLQSHGVAPEK
jgi:carboxymethylenebutenolidase